MLLSRPWLLKDSRGPDPSPLSTVCGTAPRVGWTPVASTDFLSQDLWVLLTLLSVDIIGFGLHFVLVPKHEGGSVWPVEGRGGQRCPSQRLGEVLLVSESQLSVFERKSYLPHGKVTRVKQGKFCYVPDTECFLGRVQYVLLAAPSFLCDPSRVI